MNRLMNATVSEDVAAILMAKSLSTLMLSIDFQERAVSNILDTILVLTTPYIVIKKGKRNVLFTCHYNYGT